MNSSPSPNRDSSMEELRQAARGVVKSPQAETAEMLPVVTVPRIHLPGNLRLRWGEWLGIVTCNSLAIAIAISGIFVMAADIWFGTAAKALLPMPAIFLLIFGAALVVRLYDGAKTLRRYYRLLFILGIVLTSLILIRLRVFPALAPGDWSWLASLNTIFSLEAEQPHAELGLVLFTVLAWFLGERLARNAGDSSLRRNAFLGFFILLISALVLGELLMPNRQQASTDIALFIPAYIFCGLLMVAQVRLAEVRSRLLHSGGSSRRTLVIWQLSSLGFVLSTILAALVLTIVFYGRSYDQALAALGAVWSLIVDIFIFVITPLVSFAVLLYQSLLGSGRHRSTSTTGSSPQVPQRVTHLSPQVTHGVYVGLLLASFAIIALILLLRTLRSPHVPDDESAYEETRETLGRQQSPRSAVLQQFPKEEAPSPGTVRAAYREFLRQGAKAGMAREPAETPEEYAARLAPYMGMATPSRVEHDVTNLTRDYEEERYGAVASTPDRFARAQAAVRRIAARLPHPRPLPSNAREGRSR